MWDYAAGVECRLGAAVNVVGLGEVQGKGGGEGVGDSDRVEKKKK